MLSIEFEGEQENYDTNGGVEVYIKLAIEIDVTTPTHTDEITMTYTNENKDVKKKTSTDINFESKYGLMIYDQIYNYNEAGDDVEVINDEETTIELDKDAESKELEIRTYLINNHNKEIENVVYIGTIPSENDNNTFTATLDSVKTNNEDVKIYYSTNIDATENDESWTEDSTDAVAYKLVIDKMESQETIKVSTKITIPENLGTNQEGEITQNISYLYNEAEQTRSATIGLMTEYEIALASASSVESLESGVTTEVAEGLDVTIYAVSANEELSDGDSIYEGQTVKYYITIENNTGEDLSNISVSATQTNGKVWGIDVRSEYNPVYDEGDDDGYGDYEYYDQLDTSELDIDTIESLASGESSTLEYEAYANNLEDCDGTTMYGTITITAEDEDINTTMNTISNEIQEAEISLKFIQTTPKNFGYTLSTLTTMYTELEFTNLTDQTLSNVMITIYISNNLNYEDGIELDEEDETITIQNTETNDNGETLITILVSELTAGETKAIELLVTAIEIDEDTDTASLYATATVNEKIYYSNTLTDTIYNYENDLTIEQYALVNDENVDSSTRIEDGDIIEYIATITNNEDESVNVEITDFYADGAEVQSASFTVNGTEIDLEEYIYEDGFIFFIEDIPANSSVILSVKITLEVGTGGETEFTNEVLVSDTTSYKEYISTLTLTTASYTYEESDSNETSGDDTSDTNNNTSDNEDDSSGNTDANSNSSSNGSTNTDSNNSTSETTYTISGTVWNDSDKDGQRDSSESKISGITVKVIDVSSGEVIDTSTSTGYYGGYSLSLEEGTYIIIFLYDTSAYSITTYQASGVSDDVNSDAIKKNVTIDGTSQTVAATDNISLTSDTTNIDLGLIESSEANLSIAKYVTQIIVENSTGTKTYTQDDEETLAKVEIGSKVISGSNVTVEYVIEITNSGEQSGDIGTIVDYLPSELSFSTSSNSGWYESGDYIYNDSLENEEIEPGETKEVTLILTKTMTDSNTGLINNKTGLLSSDGETEISTASADIMIGIKTGTVITYISLIIIILLVILIAIYVINEKHILEKMFSR